MSITVVAGDSNVGERARRAGHEVATRLVADVRDVSCTCFVAPFTHVLSIHGTGKVNDHVIMSFDIIVLYIKSFSGVYLHFKHDFITVQTVVENYLILSKVFLETNDFGEPASLDKSIQVVSSKVRTT